MKAAVHFLRPRSSCSETEGRLRRDRVRKLRHPCMIVRFGASLEPRVLSAVFLLHRFWSCTVLLLADSGASLGYCAGHFCSPSASRRIGQESMRSGDPRTWHTGIAKSTEMLSIQPNRIRQLKASDLHRRCKATPGTPCLPSLTSTCP